LDEHLKKKIDVTDIPDIIILAEQEIVHIKKSFAVLRFVYAKLVTDYKSTPTNNVFRALSNSDKP
jgi:hypothetical protein